MPDCAHINEALPKLANARVLVLGDYCLDKYLYIDRSLDEPSVETDLTAYQVTRKAMFAGAAGTVTANLRALGAQVACVGLAGSDGEGFELMRCLDALGADRTHMVVTEDVCTNTYTKPMRQNDAGEWVELNRLDFRSHRVTPPVLEQALLDALEAAVPEADAVLVCDQFTDRNQSVMTDRVRDGLAELAGRYPDKLFYADSRGFIGEYRGCVVKCNHLEAARCVGLGEDASLLDCARSLYARNGKNVVITRGERGSVVFDGEAHEVPAIRVAGPIDICGAGDANSAGFVLGCVCGLSPEDAAYFANIVSSITIRKLGVTGTATPDEVRAVLKTL